jgi:hypothetical protein
MFSLSFEPANPSSLLKSSRKIRPNIYTLNPEDFKGGAHKSSVSGLRQITEMGRIYQTGSQIAGKLASLIVMRCSEVWCHGSDDSGK